MKIILPIWDWNKVGIMCWGIASGEAFMGALDAATKREWGKCGLFAGLGVAMFIGGQIAFDSFLVRFMYVARQQMLERMRSSK